MYTGIFHSRWMHNIPLYRKKKNRFSITHSAIKKYCRPRHVNTRNLRFHSSRSQRPGIEVLAGVTSPESSLLGVRMATSSL